MDLLGCPSKCVINYLEIGYIGVITHLHHLLTFYKLPGTSKQIHWNGASLKDHPVRPLSGVVGPLPNGLNGLQMGVTNYLLPSGKLT